MAWPIFLKVLHSGEYRYLLSYRFSALNETRLPCHLRQITHECVYFRSRDKDGGQLFDPPYPKTPCCKLHGSIEWELLRLKFCIAGIWNFASFATVTLTLTRWPSYTNLTRIPWRYRRRAKINFLRQLRLSKVIVLYVCMYIVISGIQPIEQHTQTHTYIHTDRQTDTFRQTEPPKTIPRRFAGGNNNQV